MKNAHHDVCGGGVGFIFAECMRCVLAREDNLLESQLIGVRGLLLRWIYAATVLRRNAWRNSRAYDLN